MIALSLVLCTRGQFEYTRGLVEAADFPQTFGSIATKWGVPIPVPIPDTSTIAWPISAMTSATLYIRFERRKREGARARQLDATRTLAA